MLRYASRAPSIDHQWATYDKSTSSVLKDIFNINMHNSFLCDYVFAAFAACRAGIHPTLISPIRETIHHILLLVSGCESQRFARHCWLVVDISVKHIDLAGAAQTESDNPLSKTVGLQASSLAARTERRTPSKNKWITSQHAHRGESQHISARQ